MRAFVRPWLALLSAALTLVGIASARSIDAPLARAGPLLVQARPGAEAGRETAFFLRPDALLARRDA